MDDKHTAQHCSDCDHAIDRRGFLTTAAGAAVGGAMLPALSQSVFAAPTPNSPAEKAVRSLYETLSEDQRTAMVLPLDDKRRHNISANWSITKANIGSFTKAQQEIIHQIIKGITSEDGYGRFIQQMKEDWGSVEKYSIAIFGDPTKDQFEFELTGRHLTMRADGNTLGTSAFGGPIVYGHSKKGNSEKNLFSYQTRRANEVFAALEGKQREKALLEKAPSENAVQLYKEGEAMRGISCSELASDQKQLVEAVLRDIMAPYRKEDVDEVMEIVKAGGGIDKISISFYQQGDLDGDKVWDVWRLEGPTIMTHFRGSPHVHAYINVAKRA